ncbi:MAG: glycosyl hydrolase [Pseudomonadota bacterium]
MKKFTTISVLLGTLVAPATTFAADHEANPLAAIPLRHIGPAITSGRIADFAFHPKHKHVFFAATASGNLFKTDDNAISWQSLFENETSYSIGVIELAPSDSKVVWVGSGENNAQRSVAYGDGVYKSIDGGKTWSNMGLKDSGHISQIWIHPDDANHVLVAAQGPLWNEGGDRGLYRTQDGGTTWEKILEVDEHTGVNEFVVDPRNFSNIVASTYQRRRHVWVLINGGPGSGIHKTTDGGASWSEVTSGLPSDDMGRIGLAGASSAPDMIYAMIEGNDEEKGVYRSIDFGSSWEKRSGHMTTSAQYYNEIVVDPQEPNRVYSLDTFTQKSEDGGKTFAKLGNDSRHVDDHALWIDPDNTKHLYIGGDGGIYESWDRGSTWRHVRNLSITQFYRIQPDNAEPFYNVCGGTQDNNSLCAPSRTTYEHGIANADWRLILGGDGYKPQFDPLDPNIIYTQWQYGNLYRYDRRTQERVSITPHPESGEPAYKWNWSTPVLVSPHNRERIYYAAEYLFRSDDRGDSWRKVSGDLTRGVDRNKLEVMGRVWSVDAIAKNDSTSRYGSAIGLSESPLVEGLIYIGSDDGVISVTEDGGENWRRVTTFPDVPDMSLVEDVIASVHDPDVAYAVFDNHKRGDFKPYVLRTDDRGRSWTSMSGDLPERGSAHTIAEDHENPGLLFVGTEFGLFFTQNTGEQWHALKSNFPTIAVRDLEIQRRESDLVVGTFGRGIYILDDYSALRTPVDDIQAQHLFPARDTWLYLEGDLWGSGKKGSQGDAFYAAANPPYGAVFSYHLEEAVESRATTRRKAEIKTEKEGGDTPYPSWEELRAEDLEIAPSVYLMIRDAEGSLVRQVAANNKAGMHRSPWDLRLPAPGPVELEAVDRPSWAEPPKGPLALPGTYSARLAILRDGALTEVGPTESFKLKALESSPEITDDRRALQAFQVKAANLQRAVAGAVSLTRELDRRVEFLREAIVVTPAAGDEERAQLQSAYMDLAEVKIALSGDKTISGRNESAPVSISSRISGVYYAVSGIQSSIGSMLQDSYSVAVTEFSTTLPKLQQVVEDLNELEERLELKGAPWTPGRVPQWEDS